jgi:FixJ family two-component response regulator
MVRDRTLLASTAFERDRIRHKSEKEVSDLRAKFETLSPREQEVMALVTVGLKKSRQRHAQEGRDVIG